MFDTLPIFRLIYDSRSGEVPKGLTGSHEFGQVQEKNMWRGLFVAARSLLQSDPQILPSSLPAFCSWLNVVWETCFVKLSTVMGSSNQAPRGGAISQNVQAPRSNWTFSRLVVRPVQIISSFHYTPYVRAKLPSLHGHGNLLHLCFEI
jgi:hypothetical protein